MFLSPKGPPTETSLKYLRSFRFSSLFPAFPRCLDTNRWSNENLEGRDHTRARRDPFARWIVISMDFHRFPMPRKTVRIRSSFKSHYTFSIGLSLRFNDGRRERVDTSDSFVRANSCKKCSGAFETGKGNRHLTRRTSNVSERGVAEKEKGKKRDDFLRSLFFRVGGSTRGAAFIRKCAEKVFPVFSKGNFRAARNSIARLFAFRFT